MYPPGVQRRKFLNQVAQNNFTNTTPEEIKQKYYDIFLKKIAGLYFYICYTIPEIKNWLSNKDSKNTNTVNTLDTDKKICFKLAENRLQQESLLINWIIYKTIYNSYQNQLFTHFKAFASKRDKLYNLFVIALGDFEYLVNRFIRVTNANTK